LGCLEYGEEFARDFLSLTSGWEGDGQRGVFLNDRASPAYVRASAAAAARAEECDRMLAGLVPDALAKRVADLYDLERKERVRFCGDEATVAFKGGAAGSWKDWRTAAGAPTWRPFETHTHALPRVQVPGSGGASPRSRARSSSGSCCARVGSSGATTRRSERTSRPAPSRSTAGGPRSRAVTNYPSTTAWYSLLVRPRFTLLYSLLYL
jgi:hypothetical protein